jgi:hypothetical protein
MNTTLKRLGTFLLLSGALLASAANAQSWGWGPLTQNDRRQQDRRGDDRRQSPDRFNSDRHFYDRDDQSRRSSRMSPDERRALRQQIDEAGRDIYRPRR